MTAPADVWLVVKRDGSLATSHNGTCRCAFIAKGDAEGLCLPGESVVRFRLVRADEPEQPQREDPHALDNALTDFLKGYCPFSATQLQSAVHALCRMAIKGQSDLDHLRDTVRTLVDAVCGPEQPREDVGELRECVRELACLVHDHAINLVGSAEFAEMVDRIIDRLAAPEQAGGAT